MKNIRMRIARSIGLLTVAPLSAFADSQQTLQNPTKFNDIQSFIAAALKAVVQISLPILTLFIVYAGFLFVFARGNEKLLGRAKQNLLYAILGAMLVLGAWALATLLGATASQVIGTS